jgi:hypothetical protein
MMRRMALILGILLGVCASASSQEPLLYKDPPLKAEDRQHWSFIAPQRPTVPKVRVASAVRTPIDAFVLKQLESKGLSYSPEADRLVLLRRLSFDLIGLPPTPEEVATFLQDRSANAYEKQVDRLLASPHFGERWAQHWLDAVRYAESNGYEMDAERPHAWRYRDYVVRSLNADKPYDQFLTEQLAGDLLAVGKSPREAADLLEATGFHRCGQTHVVSGNVDQNESRQEVLTEMVTGVSSAILGLTIACARCHDHKFDPISAGDYYRLQAFFAGTFFKDVDLATAQEKEEFKKLNTMIDSKLSPIKKQISAIEVPYRAKLNEEKRAALPSEVREALAIESKKRTPEQKKLADSATPKLKVSWDEVLNALNPEDRKQRDQLKEQENELKRQKPLPTPMAWAVADRQTIPPTHVLKRGDVSKKALLVQPAPPRVLYTSTQEWKTRLDLAKWLTNPSHPLTARVIVNRLWQHHFGRGIVASPNDFGTRGTVPTHPELLDWLAKELVEPSDGGKPWTLKRLHRLIVCSTVYRQASRVNTPEVAAKADPENHLLWKMNRRRLEAESIRDAILSSANTLNRSVGGPSVKVPLEPEVYDLIFTEDEPSGLWPVTVDSKQHTRRSLYLFLKRNVRIPLLEAFDQPDTLSPCAARSMSTFAPQALILMNSPFSHEQAQRMADSLWEHTKGNEVELIVLAYQRTLGRVPRDAELLIAKEFLKSQTAEQLPRLQLAASRQAVADLCLALFNLNEFVYIP